MNKVKNNIYVRSKLQLCQLEIPIFINKLMCKRSLMNWISFVYCEFNRVVGWNEGKAIILVRSSFQIPKHWFHIQGQPMSMKTFILLVVNLKVTLVVMCWANYFDIIECWKLIVGRRDIYYAKKYLILSYVWRLEFL